MIDEEDYEESVVDSVCSEPSDLEDPVCMKCGSTSWVYCTLGDNNKIRKCSDCPIKKEFH